MLPQGLLKSSLFPNRAIRHVKNEALKKTRMQTLFPELLQFSAYVLGEDNGRKRRINSNRIMLLLFFKKGRTNF